MDEEHLEIAQIIAPQDHSMKSHIPVWLLYSRLTPKIP
jgi:hypothetical protein